MRKTDLPKQRVREATRGAILARKAAGVPLLVELLRSQDKQTFNLGLTVARELPGKKATEALTCGARHRLLPERQSLLILAIADRGDAAGLPAMLQAAKSGPDSVQHYGSQVAQTAWQCFMRAAAVGIGGLTRNPELAIAPRWSRFPDLAGKEVDAQIVARLPKAEGKGAAVSCCNW